VLLLAHSSRLLTQAKLPQCDRSLLIELDNNVCKPHLQQQAHVRAPQDLASGYMSGKLLLKLDSVAFILVNHTSKNFAFLDQAVNSRARTSFYHTLARLLFMEDTPAKFKAFVAPLQQVG